MEKKGICPKCKEYTVLRKYESESRAKVACLDCRRKIDRERKQRYRIESISSNIKIANGQCRDKPRYSSVYVGTAYYQESIMCLNCGSYIKTISNPEPTRYYSGDGSGRRTDI